MKEHPIEKIAFDKRDAKLKMDYGGSRVNGRSYRHCFTLDGKLFANDGMHFGPFRDMLEKPGDYWPFCCSLCGESGCDGIFAPIRCLHHGDEIILIIREPMWDSCDSCKYECQNPRDGDEFFCPHYHVKYRAHRVKKAQMRAALEELERWTPPA